MGLLLLISFKSFAEGRSLYKLNCSSCHHEDRIGKSGPPLLSDLIEKIPDEKLSKIIRNGLPNTLMPGNTSLTEGELAEVVAFLRTKSEIKWRPKDIKKSLEKKPCKT